jgi:hypothetical protein
MKRHLWGLALAGMLIGAAGCFTDPTADIAGAPDRIVPTYSQLLLFPGDSLVVTAQVRDEQGAALAIPVTVSSSDPAVAAVGEDPLAPYEDTRFFVRAEAPGGATVTLTAEGLTTEMIVSVFPLVFEGDVSVVSSAILDTVVIGVGATGLEFVADTAGGATLTEVLIDEEPTRLVSITPTEIKVIPLTVDGYADATMTLNGLLFLPGTQYAATIATLDAADPVTTGPEDNEPGNDDPGTATPITVGGAALEGLITADDVDDFFVFTLAADASVTVTVEFNGAGGDPDLDVYVLNAAGGGFCVLDGCAMATGSQPEEWTGTLPAGTYTVLVELWDSGAEAVPHWYRVKID